MAHIYLSAAHKSSGKTTLAIGLCRALTARGLAVQPFKKGPDYIDPLWLAQAARRDCLNLDFNTMEPAEIQDGFARALDGAGLGLIEGNVGLFDSVDLAGTHSNAELAKLLGAPVVLVLDAQGMGRGVAPLLLGYRAFDAELNLAGVILNKVGGSRHERTLRQAVEHYTDLAVLGAVERDPAVQISERHLGLMPSNEAEEADERISRIAERIAAQVDLDRLLGLAATARAFPAPAPAPAGAPVRAGTRVRIGVARDEAFGFYYPDDLAALRRGGAELVPFSPVRDPELPDVDGLFIGGGFPEYRMRELEANRTMRGSVRAFVERGGPVYAECGGLMYLCQGLRWGEERREMCGVLAADVAMHERPQGRGYVELEETAAFPWPAPPGAPRTIRAHEFHHSAVVAANPDWVYGYRVRRGTGVDGRHDGIVQRNLLAAYTHLRDVGGVGWTARFLAHVRRCAGA